jgi:Flp pilus assembly protein TadG
MCTIDSSTTDLRSNNSVPSKHRLTRFWGGEQGSNILEMAFVVILMLSLMVGAVDLGYAYQHYGVVLNASRESARLYSRLPCTGTNRNALRSAIIDAAVTEGGGGKVTILGQNVKITPNPTSGCPTPGTTVDVSVSVLYQSQFGELIGLGNIPITAATSMMYYGNDTSQSGS